MAVEREVVDQNQVAVLELGFQVELARLGAFEAADDGFD